MPASRIAFALADFLSEAARLLPADHKMGVVVRLDSVAFDAVVHQLKEYGASAIYQPAAADRVDSIKFGGVVIERMAHA